MTTADQNACEHCDDSAPHSHVDERPLVEGYRRDLLVSAVLGALGTPVAAALWATTTGVAVVVAVLAWALCTLVGVVSAAVAGRTSPRRGVLVGALVSAGLAPVTTLGVTAVLAGSTGGATPWVAAVAATSGWFCGAGAASAVRALHLRDALVADSRDGEAARSAVVRTGATPGPLVEIGWAGATALWFGVCAALVAVLPVVAVVLMPLGVALAVLSRRAHARAAQQPVGATV